MTTDSGPPAPLHDSPSKPEILQLNDLLSRMEHGSTTSNWDAIASYDITALNGILAAGHAAGTVVSKIVHDFDLQELGIHAHYDLTFAAPTIAFITGTEKATLTMEFEEGSTCVITNQGGFKKTFDMRYGEQPTGSGAPTPTPYSLVMTVPLAAMSGGKPVATRGEVFQFTSPDSASIVLQIAAGVGSGITYDVSPTPPQGTEDVFSLCLVPLLETYFRENISALDYSLTGVTPKRVPGEFVIVPMGFMFTTTESVLSVYIQVDGRDRGDSLPVFLPGPTPIAPIPAGFTSSLILSRQLVTGTYITPVLQQLGVPTYVDGQPGIAVSFSLRSEPVRSYDATSLGQYQFHCQTLVVDMSKFPFSIVFHDNTVKISWQFSANVSWSSDLYVPATGDTLHENGNTTVYLTLGEPDPSNPSQFLAYVEHTLPSPTSSDISLNFELDASNFRVSYSPETDSWSSGTNIGDKLAGWMSSLAPVKLSFSFGYLNYFATANLLFPRSHQFTVDGTSGMHIPCDVLLLGTIS